MKAYKTMLSVVLAIMMLVTVIVPTWAASGTNSDDGKITIDNAVAGQTYTIYQILKLESYNTETGAYAYKATTAWKSFVESEAIKDVYLKTDDQGYVTWVKDADPAAFAKQAAAYAADTENNIENQGTTKATTITVKFDNLDLGYYLVTTTLGSLCSLDTTNPSVTIKEKNSTTIEKEVQEDSNDGWGETNDADIGQKVEYRTELTIQPGAQKYIVHDVMSTGLTFDDNSIVVKQGDTTLAEKTATNTNGVYTVVKASEITDGCTFEIKFEQSYLDSINSPTNIVITYNANLNDSAVVGLGGNTNKTKLEYGNEGTTEWDTTTTYTWDMDVFKYTKNGDNKTPLEGVKFVLIKKENITVGEATTVVEKVATVVNGKLTKWEDVPTAVNGVITWPAGSVLTTGTDGKISVDGLDADTYYLREIEALPGFNILSEDKEFTIVGATEDEETGKLTYTTVTVEVENKSGTELPSTGGIGTTIFYCAGAILALGAFVLLVTKKRMGRE